MEKKTKDYKNLKDYTNSIREFLDNNTEFTKKDIDKIKNKFKLSEPEELKLNSLIDKSVKSAENAFEFGEWKKVTDLLYEVLTIDPFNERALHLYILTENQMEELISRERSKDYPNLLKRLEVVNKKLFKEVTKKEKKPIKFNRLFLLLLIIPVLVLIPFLLPKKDSKPVIKYINPETHSLVGDRNINVVFENRDLPLNFEIYQSLVVGKSSSYTYSLKGEFYSLDNNIKALRGNIIWQDRFSMEIFREEFLLDSIEYYKGEKIPFIYFKSGKRVSPDINTLYIELLSADINKGQDRVITRKVDALESGSPSFLVEIDECELYITKGVKESYMSLLWKLKNIGKESITKLNGYIVWYDEYNVLINREFIDIINIKDIPLNSGDERVFNRTLEINEYNSNYRFEIEEVDD